MGKKKKRSSSAKSDASPGAAPAISVHAPTQRASAEAPAVAPVAPWDASDATRPAPPTPPTRALENAFIACFLLFMLAMPLRYYLGGRGFDERFSWRMFSTVRMLDCDVLVEDTIATDGEPKKRRVDLGQEVQVAWVGLLERARELVIAKVLARRCQEAGVVEVSYHLSCKSTDGSKLPDVDRSLRCGTPAGAR